VRKLDMGKQNDVNTYVSQYLNDPRIQIGGFHMEGGHYLKWPIF
jgi:hypothetical protein